MGFFSNKTKIVVTVNVLRVIEDHRVPNTAKSAVGRALITSESLSEAMMVGLSESVSLKVERMYRWAEKDYFYGTPSSTLTSNITGVDIVRQVIEKKLGKPITIDYMEYAPANSIHMGWEALIKHYEYNPASNQLGKLSREKGTPVYLKDMLAVYTPNTFDVAEPGTLAQWGVPATSGYTPERLAQSNPILGTLRTQSNYVVDADALYDHIEVSYVFEDASGELVTEALELPMSGYDSGAEYYHVKYSYIPAIGAAPVTEYWSYMDGAGEYSEIDGIFLTKFEEVGSYLPMVHLVKYAPEYDNPINLARVEEKWFPPHISSTKLCKFLGFDYQDFGDGLWKNGGSGNEQIVMLMGVPINTTNPIEAYYLFHYFSLLYYNSPAASGESSFSDFTPRAGKAIQIKDKAFTMTLTYQGIARRRVAGKIGKVGTCISGERVVEHAEDFTQRTNGISSLATKTVSTPCHYFRKQVTELMYEEIAVYGASLRYYVRGTHSVVATGKDGKLLIPLDFALTKTIPIARREELYSRSFHNVFTTYVEIEEKWYSNPLVSWIIVIVAVAISVMSGGTLATGMAGLITTLSAITLTQVLTYVLVTLAIQYGTQLFLKFAGPKLGAFGAILVLAVGVYLATTGETGSLEATWGDTLLQVGNGLMEATNASIAEAGNAYLDKLQEFSLLMSEQQKELAEANKLLDTGIDLNPFDVLRREPFIIPAESPEDFYQRTIHVGNIGARELDAFGEYHTNKLRLPTLAETMLLNKRDTDWGTT